MKRSLTLLLALLVLSGPVEAKAKRNKASSEQQKTESSSPANSTASEQDLGKTLDEVLSKPLQGGVEQADIMPSRMAPPEPSAPLPLPVVKDRTKPKLDSVDNLRGNAHSDSLQGQAQSDDNGSISGFELLKPKADTAKTVLKGGASLSGGRLGLSEDPDVEDQELMIQWDKWRNRFLRAVQQQVQANVNNPDDFEDAPRVRIDPMTGYIMPRFPLGTVAWFACDITADRRVKNLRITESSGIPAYDRAVINGIRALEGTSLLQYPAGSRRLSVSQEAGIKTASQADFRYHNFGDVERFRTPR